MPPAWLWTEALDPQPALFHCWPQLRSCSAPCNYLPPVITCPTCLLNSLTLRFLSFVITLLVLVFVFVTAFIKPLDLKGRTRQTTRPGTTTTTTVTPYIESDISDVPRKVAVPTCPLTCSVGCQARGQVGIAGFIWDSSLCMYVYSLYQTRRVSRARNQLGPD